MSIKESTAVRRTPVLELKQHLLPGEIMPYPPKILRPSVHELKWHITSEGISALAEHSSYTSQG